MRKSFLYYCLSIVHIGWPARSRHEHLLAVQTHVKQNHRRIFSLLLRLEKHTLLVGTVRTCFVGSGQRWIRSDILHHTGGFTNIGNKLVSVNLGVFRQLGVVTVSAGVKKSRVLLVLSGIQHIVAFCAETERRHGGVLRGD